MCWIKSWADSFAKGRFWSGTKCALLPNLSTIVSTAEFSSEQGRPLTKSKDVWDCGQMGARRGCWRPAGAWWEDLCWLQVTQERT